MYVRTCTTRSTKNIIMINNSVMSVSLTQVQDDDWLTLSHIILGYDSNGVESAWSILRNLNVHTLLRGQLVLSNENHHNSDTGK